MKKFWEKWKELLYDGFLFVIIYEILEEILEDLIALAITDVFFGILSRVFCITIAQAIKFFVKRTIKALTVREGDDKMKLLKKILYGLYFNKCTIIMSVLSAFSAYCAYIILPLPLWAKLTIGGTILLTGIMCAINIGWETYTEIIERLNKNKEKRKNKKAIKAQKKLNKQNNKIAKRKEKDIKRLAKKLEKDNLKKMKLNERKRLADMKLRLLNEAKIEYEQNLRKNEANLEANIENLESENK